MHLVIFDLDGTLTQTYYGGDNSYVSALSELIPIDPDYKYWQDCEHLTDSAVLHHIYHKVLQRSPEEHEVSAMQERFISRLQAKLHAHPEFFHEIPGAKQAIDLLLKQPNTIVGVATGGWERAARFKLEQAGFPVDELLIIGSDRHHAKHDFVAELMNRARLAHSIPDFLSVHYVGDSRYDYSMALELELNFIGIDYNAAGFLQEVEAPVVLQDYTDTQLFFSHLGF